MINNKLIISINSLVLNYNSPSDFIRDSAFRLKVGEELMTKIEEGKVVIERKV